MIGRILLMERLSTDELEHLERCADAIRSAFAHTAAILDRIVAAHRDERVGRSRDDEQAAVDWVESMLVDACRSFDDQEVTQPYVHYQPSSWRGAFAGIPGVSLSSAGHAAELAEVAAELCGDDTSLMLDAFVAAIIALSRRGVSTDTGRSGASLIAAIRALRYALPSGVIP